jgi:GTP cyclohydrolase I
MDPAMMEAGIRTFLEGVGERFEGDDLEQTPARVARAWCEDLVGGYAIEPQTEITWAPVELGLGPVVVRDIRFTSVCVHHLLPFFGQAHVGYLPGERLVGLSKIGRVIDAHARRLQTQERLTAAVVRTLDSGLVPRGVIALLRAEHTCMTCRGARKEQGRMLTMASSGIYDSDPAARREILSLIEGTTGLANDG